jgi:hypothetical protein
MARRLLFVVGLVVAAAACSQGAAPPSLTSTTAPLEPATTSPSSTTTAAVSADPPRLASVLEGGHSLPIEVVDDAVIHVDGLCVIAETADTTFLLIIDFRATVLGSELRLDGFSPGVVPPRVLSSGDRYQLRGSPVPPGAELVEPVPPGCDHDERMLLLGALDSPVGHGLATHPVEVWEGFPAIGVSDAEITIEGPCATIIYPTGNLLVIWPAGTVSLVDDHTIHISRWEGFTEIVVRSGDTLDMQGSEVGLEVGYVDDAPPGCEFDGYFAAGAVFPPRP